MRTLLLASAVLALSACDVVTSSSPSTVRYTVDAPATVAYTAADGSTQTARTSGSWETEVSVGDASMVALTATSVSGAPVTASIFVGGRLAGSRRGPAVRVESSAHHGDRDGAKVRGPIETVGSDRVTVAGLVFLVDGSTRLRDGTGTTTTLASFAVGQYVEVKGTPLGDGTYLATKLKVEDDDEDGEDNEDGLEVEVHGPIQSIDATTVTVGSRVFTTTDATRYRDGRLAVARDAFVVGTQVEVEGYVDTAGTLVAKTLKVDTEDDDHDGGEGDDDHEEEGEH